MNPKSIMRQRQNPLMRLYKTEPRAAWVTDQAKTTSEVGDPLHGQLIVGKSTPLEFSLHTAVGGESDAPVPGDILSAALASCLDSTVRVIADRLAIKLESVAIEVKSEVDVRGTLCVSTETPVGFQQMSVGLDVVAASDTDPETLENLVRLAEYCCVCLQTLRHGVPVSVNLNGEVLEASHAA